MSSNGYSNGIGGDQRDTFNVINSWVQEIEEAIKKSPKGAEIRRPLLDNPVHNGLLETLRYLFFAKGYWVGRTWTKETDYDDKSVVILILPHNVEGGGVDTDTLSLYGFWHTGAPRMSEPKRFSRSCNCGNPNGGTCNHPPPGGYE